MQKRILVTGAAGFIGHALSKRLIKEGHHVVGLDNINDYYDVGLKYDRLTDLGIDQNQAAEWGQKCESKEGTFIFVRMNLEDREQLPALFQKYKFDAVVNLAAQAGVRYSLENPMAYVDSNLVGFVNVLESCRHHQIKHLVYASSSSVYGANKKIPFAEEDRVDYPVSLYAATKKSNELMAHTYSHLYKIPTSGLRFFTVYGAWGRPDMAPILFASAISENRPIKVFNYGEMRRDFTYIDDIVQGIIITLNHPPTPVSDENEERKEETDNNPGRSPYFQLFNIGNGFPVDLMDFIKYVENEFGKTANKLMLPMQAGDVPQTYADTTKLNALGYQSTTHISEGVKRFVSWFKEYYYNRL